MPQQHLEGAEPEAGPSGSTRPRRSAAGGSASAAGERFQVNLVLKTYGVLRRQLACALLALLSRFKSVKDSDSVVVL